MNRRDILKGAVAGAGALSAEAAQQHQHAPRAADTPAVRTAAAWKPLFLDKHQNETVTVLAELIIPRTNTPGAREARVNEYIDLILNDGPQDPSMHFVQGLSWLDGYALRLHHKPFVRCTAEQQTAMLTALDRAGMTAQPQTLNRAGTPDRAAELDRPVAPPIRPGGPAATAGTGSTDVDLAPGARFFRQIKMLTVSAYYTSEIGINELNKGGRVPASFGCTHPEGH
ncbi:MAG TPA: gluconate 2-dehydrogenase subunit 3 family protein [Bryobacteraceae bacterium]|nr:gluconate 2-dehydrogenase subunit 3 family protein [Bryobacteraceae bacterium]